MSRRKLRPVVLEGELSLEWGFHLEGAKVGKKDLLKVLNKFDTGNVRITVEEL